VAWNSYPAFAEAGAGFRENMFSSHSNTLMKLMASTVLSPCIRRQYSSVCPLLSQCLL